jgi:hypothetical protein
MTDLRELLREVRVELAIYRADCPAVEEEFVDGVDPVATLIECIDAALAQPPDAKPVAKVLNSGKVWLDPEAELSWGTLLYASAPQPPAGKGVIQAKCSECGKQSTPDSMWALYCLDCCESIRAHSATDAVRTEPMQRQPIQDSSASGAASIPCEIHERLVRDAKRGRWILHNVGLVNDWAIRDWNPESGITLIAYLEKMVDAAMASEHERGG